MPRTPPPVYHVVCRVPGIDRDLTPAELRALPQWQARYPAVLGRLMRAALDAAYERERDKEPVARVEQDSA